MRCVRGRLEGRWRDERALQLEGAPHRWRVRPHAVLAVRCVVVRPCFATLSSLSILLPCYVLMRLAALPFWLSLSVTRPT